jgi:hypothetical protein
MQYRLVSIWNTKYRPVMQQTRRDDFRFKWHTDGEWSPLAYRQCLFRDINYCSYPNICFTCSQPDIYITCSLPDIFITCSYLIASSLVHTWQLSCSFLCHDLRQQLCRCVHTWQYTLLSCSCLCLYLRRQLCRWGATNYLAPVYNQLFLLIIPQVPNKMHAPNVNNTPCMMSLK